MEDSKTAEKKFIAEVKTELGSGNVARVTHKLRELKSTGRVAILPYILDLLANDKEDDAIINEVLQLVSDLKEQECAAVVAKYIEQRKLGKNTAAVVSACWQSRLNYSEHLSVFLDSFVLGDYQEAIEAFTVIEEMLWQLKQEKIADYRKQLMERQSEIGVEKKPLYLELLKVLDDGITENREDFPDLYKR